MQENLIILKLGIILHKPWYIKLMLLFRYGSIGSFNTYAEKLNNSQIRYHTPQTLVLNVNESSKFRILFFFQISFVLYLCTSMNIMEVF